MDVQSPESGPVVDRSGEWRLALRVGPAALDAVIYSPLHEGSLIHRNIPLDRSATSQLKAVEAAVYDNRLLLQDFARVWCVVESRNAVILPPGLDNQADDEAESARSSIFGAMFPALDSADTFLSPTGMQGVAVMAAAEPGLTAFLRRTWFNATVCHHLSPLCRYFLNGGARGPGRRLCANLRPGAVDVVASDGGRLVMANSFDTPTPADAAYFILAAGKLPGLDGRCEVMLAGNPALREAVGPLLRRYVPVVMPVIFPSQMFRAGREALEAPFDLIVLPLCE